MTEKVKSGATYDDILAAPEHKIAEIVEGDLYFSPLLPPRHSYAASGLLADLIPAFHRGRRGPGGWWILRAVEFYFSGDVLVPDIAGWKRERLPELLDSPGIDLAPDWVCEILSPSTEDFDRRQKLPRYALAGIAHLWLVDPSKRRLEVYGLLDLQWILLEEYSDDAAVSAPPFEAIAVDLAPLWA